MVNTRYSGGYQPCIRIEYPHGEKTFLIGVRDQHSYFYWHDDNPWEDIYSRQQNFPQPTHFIPRWAWIRMTEFMGIDDQVIQHHL